MSNIAIALADELGTHIEDLVDSGSMAELEMPDGGSEQVGTITDTEGEPYQASFVAVVRRPNGTLARVRVTCEEIPEPYVPPKPEGKTAKQKAFEQRPDFPGWENL